MKQSRSLSQTYQTIGVTIGNAIEWYDFLIFGYLTAILSRIFFPSTSEYASLLATAATFGVGFFMRPLGGLVIGMYADRRGRKAAMQLIIALTTVAMALVAFAPPYAAFGIGAPLIVVFARLLQGFATGGEYACSTAFLVESAPAHKRGLYGSLQSVGVAFAMLLGTAVGAFLTSNLSPQALTDWGWRVPFLAGLVICPLGFWLRRHLEDPDVFVEAKRNSHLRMPLLEVLRDHRRGLLVSMALTTGGTVSLYVMNVYMPTFACKYLGLTLNQGFMAQLICGVAFLLLVPFFGALSDRIGRKPLLIGSLTLYLLLFYPLFSWVYANHSFINLTIMLVILSCVRAASAGVASTVLAEQFPTAVRSTGMSVAYNVAVMLFGGTAQFVVTWLIQVTGSPVSMAFYVMFACAIGLVASWFVQEPSRLDSPVPQEPVKERSAVSV